MSLLTRLWLSVLAATLLSLGGSFVVSVLTARDYLQQQLAVQASDTAASLALAMTQQTKDAAMIELQVQALFDSGHFEQVSFRDVQGRVLVQRRSELRAPDAPAWFVRWVPLYARPGRAEVSDGWRRAGEVEVVANSRFAYASLWQGTLNFAALMGGIGVTAFLGVALLMRWLRRPLAAIVDQARAIGERRFLTLKEPSIYELKLVTRAMNAMVARVQTMFAEQAARIDALRDEANRDALTGVPNRDFFMGRLRDMLADETAAPLGVLLLARLSDVQGLNRRLGRLRTDAFIKAAAQVLEVYGREHAEALLARLNGTDFALLLPGVEPDQAQRLAVTLGEALGNLHRREYTDVEPVAHLGAAAYRYGDAPGALLAAADTALMRSEAGNLAPPLQPAATSTATVQPDWRQRLAQALAQRSFELAWYPVALCDGSLLHREAMLRLRSTPGEPPITAGQFMPAAARLGRTAELDLVAVELALAALDDGYGEIAVNLSPLSIEQPAFRDALARQLAAIGGRAARLWLEVSERGLDQAGGLEALTALSQLLARHGCKLGLEHFGRHFAAIPSLYALRLDYLKLDGSFVAGIDTHVGNQRFVQAVADVARSLDIRVIAERVNNRAEWDTLTGLGIHGVTGPIVQAGDVRAK